MAGPVKFDEHKEAAILRGLRAGFTRPCVAGLASVSERTLRYWFSRGRRGEEPFAAFVVQARKAERHAEAIAVKAIRKAGRKNWTAYAWWLERKFPESWGKDTELLREIMLAYRRRKKAKAR